MALSQPKAVAFAALGESVERNRGNWNVDMVCVPGSGWLDYLTPRPRNLAQISGRLAARRSIVSLESGAGPCCISAKVRYCSRIDLSVARIMSSCVVWCLVVVIGALQCWWPLCGRVG